MTPIGQQALCFASRAFDVSIPEIKGEAKSQRYCKPRYAIACVLRRRGWSLPRIGKLLGDRDHSTISNALRRADELTATSQSFRWAVEAIDRRVA